MEKKEEAIEQEEPVITEMETVQEEDEIDKMRTEVEEFKDKYLRALAEVENTRKRLSREKIESQSFAIQNMVLDLLMPIDHFEQALKHAENAESSVSHWAKGFEMILQQLQQVLTDHGVSSFDSVGAQFDPHLHEAIETEESEEIAEGTITCEFHKGYRLGSRTIRAARVKVATHPKKHEQNETNKEEQK